MIRYNANDPAIYGKKHFDILYNFGIFCLVYGACLLVYTGLLIYQTINSASYWWIGFYKAHRLVANGNVFSYALFWLIIGIGVLRPYLISKRFLTYVCVVYLLLYGLLFLAPIILITPIWRWTWEFWNIYPTILDTGLFVVTLYLVLCLRRLFQSLAIIPSAKELDTSAPATAATTDPFWITLFERWDPLNCYGKLMICYGFYHLMSGGFTVYIFVSSYMAGEMPQNLINLSLLQSFLQFFAKDFGYFIWLVFAGYGLMRYKEWGRMLTILAHIFLPAMHLLFRITALQDQNIIQYYLPAYVTQSVTYLIPLLFLSYVVCRALSHPVVKHICLRSGHQIE